MAQVRFLDSGYLARIGRDCLAVLPEEFTPASVPAGVAMVLLAGLVPNDGDRNVGGQIRAVKNQICVVCCFS